MEKNLIAWLSLNIRPRSLMLIAWAFVLCFGGLFLLVFFASTGFVPDFEPSEILVTLVGAAFATLFLLVVLAFLMAVGGIVLYIFFSQTEPDVRGAAVLCSTLFGIMLCFLGCVYYFSASTVVDVAASIVVGILLVFVAWVTIRGKKAAVSWKQWGIFITGLVIGVLLCLYHMQVFVVFYKDHEGVPVEWSWASLGAWLALQALLMSMVAAAKTKWDLVARSCLAGFFGIASLLVMSNNASFVVTRVAQLISVGGMNNHYLTVNYEGCEIFNAVAGDSLCAPVSGKRYYLVGPVDIKSRIGRQTLLVYQNGEDGLMKRMVFPSSVVKGWQDNGVEKK